MPSTTTFEKGRSYSSQRKRRPVCGPIIWGIDPTSINSIELLRVIDFVMLWRGDLSAPIIPVAVMPDLESVEISGLTAAQRDREIEAHDCIQSALDYVSPNEKLRVEVVEAAGRARSLLIERLIEIATVREAEFIAVNTHASPDDRALWRVGSFCEGLVANSPIPIIALNPRTVQPRAISKILILTDFTHEARDLLALAVKWAGQHRAELVFFHQDPTRGPTDELVDPKFLASERDLARAARAHESELWLRFARKSGVRARTVISYKQGPVERSALQVAEAENPSAIITGSRMGPLEQRILGSVAREVLVNAKCPVIIRHH